MKAVLEVVLEVVVEVHGVGEAVWGRDAVEGMVVRRSGRGEETGGGFILEARVVLQGVLKVADVVNHVLDEFEARHLAILGDVWHDLP